MLIQADHPARVVLVIAAGLAAPLGEELFFRGWLLGLLSQRFRSLTSIIVVAIVFSLVHFDSVGFVARVELGVVFGLARVWTGSLWPSVALHATHNFISTAVLYTDPDPLAELDTPFDLKSELPLAIGSLVAVIILLRVYRHLVRNIRPVEPCRVPNSYRQPLRLTFGRSLVIALPSAVLLGVSGVLLFALGPQLPGAALTREMVKSFFPSTAKSSAPKLPLPDTANPQEGPGHLK
jgi:membrane protease YdiL (CAAX protease family)